jgi:hypothetical protein
MHENIAPETAELLARVQKAIWANPEHFDMRMWVGTPEMLGRDHGPATCNTTACIAGWIVIEDDLGLISLDSLLDSYPERDVERRATRILRTHSIRLTDEASTLFYAANWPDWADARYKDVIKGTMSDKAKRKQLARLAVARIQYWIDNLE